MTARFVDTNVLVYAASKNPVEADKASTARQILRSPALTLSAQVLQEFYVEATRVTRVHPLSHKDAVEFVESLLRYPVHPIDAALVTSAIAAHARYKISYWDAAIIEAARAMRCDVVLSEDLSHGQDYGGVIVVNPFS